MNHDHFTFEHINHQKHDVKMNNIERFECPVWIHSMTLDIRKNGNELYQKIVFQIIIIDH